MATYWASTNIGASSDGEVSVTCPAGQVALGGGYGVYGGSSADPEKVDVFINKPTDAGTGWYTKANNGNTSYVTPGDVNVYVYARCAAVG